MDCFRPDDWWTKDKLEICLKNIDQNVDLVYHDLEIKYYKSKNFLIKKIIGRQLNKPILNNLLIDTIKKELLLKFFIVVRKEMLKKLVVLVKIRIWLLQKILTHG